MEDKTDPVPWRATTCLFVSCGLLAVAEHWSLTHLFALSFPVSLGSSLYVLLRLVAGIGRVLRKHVVPFMNPAAPSFSRQLHAIILVIVVATTAVAWKLIPASAPKGYPLFNGPPQFVILSLMTALALYLRQVNLNATEMLYKIRHRKLWNRTPESDYADEKAQRLEATSTIIMVVTPYLFGLILVACGRIIADSYSRFSYSATTAPNMFYKLDCLLTIWISLVFCGLTAAHFIVKRRDEKIRCKVRDHYRANRRQNTERVPNMAIVSKDGATQENSANT